MRMPRSVHPRRVVTISLLVNVLDVLTNLVVVLITGSAVIFAGLAMGLADVFGSVLLVVGERRARRPRDARYPFGYAREAFFWALLSAVVMLVVGGGLSLLRGWQQVVAPQPIAWPSLALGVIVLSILTNTYAVSLAIRNLAAREGGLRAALRATAAPLVKTSLLRDTIGVLSSVVGLGALLLYVTADWLLFDGIGAIGVGALTVVFAIVVISEARGLIAGRSVPHETAQLIRDAVSSAPKVVALNRMAAVYAGGDEILVDLDLDLAENLETVEIESVIDDVQARVRAAAPEARTIRVDLNSPPLPRWRRGRR